MSSVQLHTELLGEAFEEGKAEYQELVKVSQYAGLFHFFVHTLIKILHYEN